MRTTGEEVSRGEQSEHTPYIINTPIHMQKVGGKTQRGTFWFVSRATDFLQTVALWMALILVWKDLKNRKLLCNGHNGF